MTLQVDKSLFNPYKYFYFLVFMKTINNLNPLLVEACISIFLGNPLWIFWVYKANRARLEIQRNNFELAQKRVKTSKRWMYYSIVATIIYYIIFLCFFINAFLPFY